MLPIHGNGVQKNTLKVRPSVHDNTVVFLFSSSYSVCCYCFCCICCCCCCCAECITTSDYHTETAHLSFTAASSDRIACVLPPGITVLWCSILLSQPHYNISYLYIRQLYMGCPLCPFHSLPMFCPLQS